MEYYFVHCVVKLADHIEKSTTECKLCSQLDQAKFFASLIVQTWIMNIYNAARQLRVLEAKRKVDKHVP
jgi:hypothetical protein